MPLSFAILAEGNTDRAVLENILVGYFGDQLEEEDIAWEPPTDVTGQALRQNPGGWTFVRQYLLAGRHRIAFQTRQYLVVQVDTDVSNLPEFGVPHTDAAGAPLAPDVLAHDVRRWLEGFIGPDDLIRYAGRFIYAVSIHSIECWLLPLHGQAAETSDLDDCTTKVNAGLTRAERRPLNKRSLITYTKASEAYRQNAVLLARGSQQPSLALFLASLGTLPL